MQRPDRAHLCFDKHTQEPEYLVYWALSLMRLAGFALRQVGHLVDLPAIGLASRLSAQPSAAVALEPPHCTWLAAGLAGFSLTGYPALSAPLLPVPSLSYISLACIFHLSLWGFLSIDLGGDPFNDLAANTRIAASGSN